MTTIKIELVIERQEGLTLWGRVKYNDNLIVATAENIPELETEIKNLLEELEGLMPKKIEFHHLYDIYALFQRFDFLKISTVAKHANMNPGLLRQYVSGNKNPSVEQAKRIESTLHRLASELSEATILVN
jgi:hypothetical protein